MKTVSWCEIVTSLGSIQKQPERNDFVLCANHIIQSTQLQLSNRDEAEVPAKEEFSSQSRVDRGAIRFE